MTIEKWQEEVDQWIKNYGVRYFNVLTNALILNEEVGEFSRLIARQYGEQSFKIPIKEEEVKKRISEELGDILFVVICLANQMEINLADELTSNLKKKTERDKTRHHSNKKLDAPNK